MYNSLHFSHCEIAEISNFGMCLVDFYDLSKSEEKLFFNHWGGGGGGIESQKSPPPPFFSFHI